MADLLETALDGSPARRRVNGNVRQQSTTSQSGITVVGVDQHLPSYDQVQQTPTKPQEAINAGK